MKTGNTLLGHRNSGALLALVTILALVIAPACAPVCAAKGCESGGNASTKEESCHSAMEMDRSAGQTHLAAVKSCGLGELPAATLMAKDSLSQAQSESVRVAAIVPAVAALGEFPVLFGGDAERWRVNGESASGNAARGLSVILRI